MAYPPVPTGRRIGFWVADDDIYGAEAIFGNTAGMVPTPQQFFNSYFLTSPFPAGMVWTGGLQSSASHAVPSAQEAQWFNQLLSICDGYPNILIWAIFFVNLSGFSIYGIAQPTAGFTLKRISPYVAFTIASTAGLAPKTTYNMVLQDINHKFIANMASLTTDAAGAWQNWSGSQSNLIQQIAIPNVTDAQANQGCYVVIQTTGGVATGVQAFVGLTNDQTAAFTNYMNTIKGHRSFIGALFEPEYFANTVAIQATFKSIVNGAGYYNLTGGTNNPAGGDVIMRYSTYPYFPAGGGVLRTGIAPPGDLGIHYGETGAPVAPANLVPIWTQAVVQNIVNNSETAPITIIISVNDKNNPAAVAPSYQILSGTDFYLYMSPVLRGWVASAPAYSSFLTSNGLRTTSLVLKAQVV